MKKRKIVSSVSIILVLLIIASSVFAAVPPSKLNYNECTTPGGSLTTNVNLAFDEKKPDESEKDTISYEVKHYKEDEDGAFVLADLEQNTGVAGESVRADIREYPGYAFDESNPNNKLSAVLAENQTAELAVYYKKATCTLFFFPNNGRDTITCTIPVGSTVTPPHIQDKEGYEFAGWYVDGNPVDFAEPVYGNMTIIAKWTLIENDPSYEIGEDVSFIVEHYKQTTDDEYVLADVEQIPSEEDAFVTAEPKDYIGFAENPDHPNRVSSGVVSAEDTLVLKLYYDRNTYRVVIDFGNGQVTEQEVKHGDLAQKPDTTPKKDGETFNGWIDSSTGKPVDWGQSVTGDIYIKASFAPNSAGDSNNPGNPSNPSNPDNSGNSSNSSNPNNPSGSNGSNGSGGSSGSGHSGGSSGHKGSSSSGKGNNSKDKETVEKDNLIDQALNKKDHIQFVSGYPDGTIRPQKSITRGEVAQIIYRLIQHEYREKYFSATNPYSDVNESVWCNEPISTLSNAAILKGYNDGTFGYDQNITRAEFVTIMSRFFELSGEQKCAFTDIEGHWAKNDIEKVASLGYVKGKTSTTFDPNAPITRAEAVAILNRVLERGIEIEFMLEGMKVWPDNHVSAWYYEDIQEASNGHDYKYEDSHEVWTDLT